MSEENKELERRMYEEIYNKKNLGAVDQFYATDWVCHPWPPGMPPGLDGMKQRMKHDYLALPDMQVKLEDMLAEGDKIACRWTATATHKGEFMGMPPTNKQVTITGVHIDRIAGGKIAETWNYSDMMGLMQQLGMKPPG
ncbi:ester cyclase [[Eubacterium] cellulosolvens]